MRQEPVRQSVDSGATEKANCDSVEPSAFKCLIHEVKSQRRNENTTAESHDARDGSLRYARVEADQHTHQENGASHQSPKERSQPEGHYAPFRRGSPPLLL